VADGVVRVELEPGGADDVLHVRGLASADLDQQAAAFGQDLRRAGGNAPVSVEPVNAAIEGEQRIVAGDLSGEASDLA